MKFFLLKLTALALVASTGVSSHELRGSELEPANQKPGRISCNWKSKDDKMNHAAACASRDDKHTVPYTCDGKHAKVCCTDSSTEKATMERFGTCQKVATSGGPTPTPETPVAKLGQCISTGPRTSRESQRSVCGRAGTGHTKAYYCKDPKNVCCRPGTARKVETAWGECNRDGDSEDDESDTE